MELLSLNDIVVQMYSFITQYLLTYYIFVRYSQGDNDQCQICEKNGFLPSVASIVPHLRDYHEVSLFIKDRDLTGSHVYRTSSEISSYLSGISQFLAQLCSMVATAMFFDDLKDRVISRL